MKISGFVGGNWWDKKKSRREKLYFWWKIFLTVHNKNRSVVLPEKAKQVKFKKFGTNSVVYNLVIYLSTMQYYCPLNSFFLSFFRIIIFSFLFQELKHLNIPVVEASSHENVNVDAAFFAVAQLVDKSRGRTRILSYYEAAMGRRQMMDEATDNYLRLIWFPFPPTVHWGQIFS